VSKPATLGGDGCSRASTNSATLTSASYDGGGPGGGCVSRAAKAAPLLARGFGRLCPGYSLSSHYLTRQENAWQQHPRRLPLSHR
jgi:hypothetical protein